MITRALQLREALDTYALKLHTSKDFFDQETYMSDYLSDDKWDALAIIQKQLEPLFRLTKDLERNSDLKDGVCKASYGALWEILPVMEHVLSHFKGLKKQAKAGDFNYHPGIQNSITEA
jgi:hypothetical protein